jgi:hypothetical protein
MYRPNKWFFCSYNLEDDTIIINMDI